MLERTFSKRKTNAAGCPTAAMYIYRSLQPIKQIIWDNTGQLMHREHLVSGVVYKLSDIIRAFIFVAS